MLNGAKVLVVEDEPLIAMELAQIISDASGTPSVVGSRTDATNLIGKSEFDAALLDVRLRDGTTFEIAALLFDKKIPFLFCTGDSGNRDEFRDWPDVPLITKPHSPAIIITHLVKLLAVQS